MPEQIDTRGLSRNSIRNLCIVLRFLLASFVKWTSRLIRGKMEKYVTRGRSRFFACLGIIWRERKKEVESGIKMKIRSILKFVWCRHVAKTCRSSERVAWYEPRRRKLICWSQGQNAPPAGCKPLGLVMIQSSVKPAAAGLDRVAHVNCTIRGVTFSGYVYPRNPTSTVHLPAPRPLNWCQ